MAGVTSGCCWDATLTYHIVPVHVRLVCTQPKPYVVAALNYNSERVAGSTYDADKDGKLGSVYTMLTEVRSGSRYSVPTIRQLMSANQALVTHIQCF